MYKKKSLGLGNSRDPEKLAVICFLFLMVVWRLEAMISFFLVVLITRASGTPSGTASGTYDDVHLFIKIIVSFLGGCVGKKKKHKKEVSHRYEKSRQREKGTSKYQQDQIQQQKNSPILIIANNLFNNSILLPSKMPESSRKQPQVTAPAQLPEQPLAEEPEAHPQVNVPAITAAFTTPYLIPFPKQEGSPFFDGQNITQFLRTWDDLTLNWPDEVKVRKIPLYCEILMGDYIKGLPTFKAIEEGRGSWLMFKNEVLEEFRDDDEEQQKYTEGYLRKAAAKMEKKGGGLVEYRAFILDFCEKAAVLVRKNTINEHMRVVLFLTAFSDKIGDDLCKKCNIDLDNPATTVNVFANLRREAMATFANEDSQMRKLRKQMNSEDTEAGRDKLREKMKERVKEKEVKKGRTEGGKKDEVDNLTDMMKDLKIFQLEKKLEEQLAEISANKGEQTQQSSLRPEALPYLSPNQYGNRQWPPRPSQRQQAPAPSTIRGCYYDGGSHYRENCEELKRALECGEVHRKGQGQALYLGREDSGTTIRVPFPEEKDGRIVWQKEWVENELKKKESEVKVNVIVLEKSHEGELKRSEKEEDQIEYMNGQPVVVTRVKVEEEEEYKAVIEEKRVRDRDDEGENKKKKKFAVEIPASMKILGRGEPMDVDNDLSVGAHGQEKI